MLTIDLTVVVANTEDYQWQKSSSPVASLADKTKKTTRRNRLLD
jgi:hypothetical protein